MSEFKFACPTCGQHIAGDERWAGAQIKCPSCQSEMQVPKLEAAAPPAPPAPKPAPVASSPMRLAIAPHASPPAHAPSAPAAPLPPRPPLPGHLRPEPKPGRARVALTVAIIVVAMAVVVVLVLPLINRAQDKLDSARKKDTEEAGGGQVGHIMELNQVLDATDPSRFDPRKEKPQKLPPLPPWSLDVTPATIPSGPVRGKVVGLLIYSFDAGIEVTGPAYVLTFKERIPFREVLVSLRLKPGESIQGKSWVISKETTSGAPGIVKKWQNGSDALPQQAAFASGYAMKLEFGKATAGLIEGKIYLAFPDTEQSVLAGEFQADIRVAGQARGKSGRPGLSGIDE